MACVLFRADAGPAIGTGHVMRSLALAQGLLEAGHRPIFAMCAGAPALEGRLRAEDMGVVSIAAVPGTGDDAERTAALARELRAAWVVLDGYSFDAAYHRAVASSGAKRLSIDDRAQAAGFAPDLLVNQNLHAEGMYAERLSSTRLLLGPRYALLRREFRRLEPPAGVENVARKVLVTMGGSDPLDMTGRVLDALDQVDCERLEATVVVGASNPRLESLEARSRSLRTPVRLVHAAPRMSEYMQWADVAVCSGGSTVWELAFLGRPALVGATVPVEELLVRGLVARGLFEEIRGFVDASPADVARPLGALLADRPRRARMSELGRSVVDGRGVERVVEAMNEPDGDGARRR